jgi:ketosteroid isomerase-like protein
MMGQLEEDNEELARRMIEALSDADVDFIKETYAEDFEIWVAGSPPFSGSGDKAFAVAGMPAVLRLFPSGSRLRTAIPFPDART